MTIVLIIILSLAAFLIGSALGLLLSVYNYPGWEVNKVRRHLQKDGIGYGEWNHVREFVDHNIKVIVKPNCETLYSLSFVNRKDGPYILQMPSFENYFSFAFLDTNTDVLGYFTNDDVRDDEKPGFLIYYDDEQIKDVNMPCLKLNSQICWIIGRFGVKDNADIPRINALQDSIKLIKLKDYRNDQTETN